MAPAQVLFACRKNAGRSQLSEALFNLYANPEKATSTSCGSEPIDSMYTEVPIVMKELGVTVDGSRPPQLLTQELAQQCSLFVTMGCGESCPHVPGLERQDWVIPDPHGKDLETFRSTRDFIKGLILDLLIQRGWLKEGAPAAAAS